MRMFLIFDDRKVPPLFVVRIAIISETGLQHTFLSEMRNDFSKTEKRE